MPFVCVIMPAYNASRTIRRAIESVLNQSMQEFALIIVDDMSSDATKQIAHDYANLDARVQLISMPVNGGPSVARNAGLDAADSEWIAFLDADDAWKPERLRTMTDLGRATDADCVCDNLLGYDGHLRRESRPLFAGVPGHITVPDLMRVNGYGTYDLGYVKPIVRRRFIERHEIRYRVEMRVNEDVIFLLTCLICGAKVVFLDKAFYIYTTPVGIISRVPSADSFTYPNDLRFKHALESLLDLHEMKMKEADREAIAHRVEQLLVSLETAEFDEARWRRRWGVMIRLFFQQSRVRRKLARTMIGKIVGPTYNMNARRRN